jgi:hypothetical protein
MKVAVLLSGEWRQGARSQIGLKPILDLNPDIFISTWDTTWEENLELGLLLRDHISEERVRSLYPNSNVVVHTTILEYIPAANQIHNWRSCIEQLNKSGKEYDIVILTRPDLFINPVVSEFYNCLQNIEDGTVYAIRGQPNTPLQDQLFVGTQETMSKLMLENLDLSAMDLSFNIHDYYPRYLVDKGLSIKSIEGFSTTNYAIIRPNCTDEDLYSFDRVRENAKTWWETKWPGLTYQG